MTLVPRNNNLGVSLFDNMFDDFFKDPFFTRNNAVKVMKTDIQEKDNKSVFKFIVGEKHNQTSNDINITRSILKQYKYYFDESKVVRLSTNDSKLKLTSQYNELIKNLSIYNSYIGESNSIIYETCCPTKTLKVLSQLS